MINLKEKAFAVFGVTVTYLEIIILIAIFALAIILRGVLAHTAGLWLDEATVYTLAAGLSFKELLLLQHWDTAHPPLLYVLLHGVFVLNNFKFVDIHLIRVPFFILSSLAVFPLFLLTKKLVPNSKALYVPLWYALHYAQIKVGYSMRPYAVLQFLFPIALLLLINVKKISKKNAVFINVFFIFLLFWDYASLWFFLVFFAVYGWHVLLTHNVRKILLFTPFFIAALLWTPIFITNLSHSLELENYLRPSLMKELTYLLGMDTIVPTLAIVKNIKISIFVYIFIVGALNALVVAHLPKKNRRPFLLVLSAFIIPFVTSLVFSMTISPILNYQNLLFSGLAFILLFTPLLLTRYSHIYGLTIILILIYSLRFYVSPYESLELKISIPVEKNASNTIKFGMYKNKNNAYFALRYYFLNQGYAYNYPDSFVKDEQEIVVAQADITFPNEIRNFNPNYFVFQKNQDVSLAEHLLIQSFCTLHPATFEEAKHSEQMVVVKCQNN